MEETIFENRYTVSVPMLREFQFRFTPWWLKILFLAVGLYAIVRTWQVWRFGTGVMRILMPVIAVYLLVWPLLRSHAAAANRIKHLKKLYDGVIPETTVTFRDTIEVSDAGNHSSFRYDQIIKTFRLKHSYILMLKGKFCIFLQPDGFTKGTFQEFTAFLREKCPNVKVC